MANADRLLGASGMQAYCLECPAPKQSVPQRRSPQGLPGWLRAAAYLNRFGPWPDR